MTAMTSIDINCDMGELIDGQHNYDDKIMPYISSCNISCGFHSGHPALIEKTIKFALENKVAIGAHPSYNDRENFGRRSMNIPLLEVQSLIKYQVSAMKGMVESHGSTLHHIKAHGALYNDMHKDEQIARAIIEAVQEVHKNAIIYIMAGSSLTHICEQMNMDYKEEVFADRSYTDINTLQSRHIDGAVISDTDKVLQRIDDITNFRLLDINKNSIEIHPDTICVHSDTANSQGIAKSIFHHLSNKNIEISAHRR